MLTQQSIIEINDSDLIEKGNKRNCYRHPQNPHSCLKIEINEAHLNQNDLKSYEQISDVIRPYLPSYYRLCKTSKGHALECELITDDSGEPSKSYYYYHLNEKISTSVTHQLEYFLHLLLEHRINLYDLNPKNILIQRQQGEEKIKFIDLKNLNISNSLFRLEHLHYFAQLKMKRRIKKFKTRWLYQK
jgi:hypothetical protein